MEYLDLADLNDAEAGETSADRTDALSSAPVYEKVLDGLDVENATKEQVFSSDDVDEKNSSSRGVASHNAPYTPAGSSGSFTATTSVPRVITDLVEFIPGMYRILDLVSEQGSGGLGKLHLLYQSLRFADCGE